MNNRGHAAIYTDPTTGEKVSETFKSYSRVEIEVALAAMALDTEDTGRSLTFAHPLFIASDPNLYYPCVWYHGSVRAALEHVAPSVDWAARLGPRRGQARAPASRREYDFRGGPLQRRCGAVDCLRIECAESCDGGGEDSFKKCSKCRRYYTSVCVYDKHLVSTRASPSHSRDQPLDPRHQYTSRQDSL